MWINDNGIQDVRLSIEYGIESPSALGSLSRSLVFVAIFMQTQGALRSGFYQDCRRSLGHFTVTAINVLSEFLEGRFEIGEYAVIALFLPMSA